VGALAHPRILSHICHCLLVILLMPEEKGERKKCKKVKKEKKEWHGIELP
jgi:hypothetical protein